MRNGALAAAFLKDAKARVMFLDGNGDVPFATPERRHLEGDAELAATPAPGSI